MSLDSRSGFGRAMGFALLVAAGGGGSSAQAPLQVVDAGGIVVGPVVGLLRAADTDLDGFDFVVDQGGEWAFLSLDQATGAAKPVVQVRLLYESLSCDPGGGAWGAQIGVAGYVPAVLQGQALAYSDNASPEIWKIGGTETFFILNANAQRILRPPSAVDSPCSAIGGPVPVQVRAVSLWGSLGTLPLTVRRNPFIFGDDFSSGTLGAWTSHG